MSYDATRFSEMFARYGWWRVFISWDLVIALLASILAGSFIAYRNAGESFVAGSAMVLIAVSVAMLASTLAGLAILASISDPSFVKFARLTPVGKGNVYDNIVFVFWYVATISVVSLLVDLVGALSPILTVSSTFEDWIAGAMLFFVVYTVLAVAMLVGTITRWGFFRGIVVAEGLEAQCSNPPPKLDPPC